MHVCAHAGPGARAHTHHTHTHIPHARTHIHTHARARGGGRASIFVSDAVYALQMLLSRPLLVMGPSPADCSGAVAALISLVAPLPYAPDFRYTEHTCTITDTARAMSMETA